MEKVWLLVAVAASVLARAAAVELTFELPDNAKECFYEEIEKGTECTLEYQVVTGGHYDVDVLVEGPARQILYREIKQQYGQFQFTPDHTGTYQVCFSNEFSTFSHKLIYVDFQVGDEPQLPGVGEHFTAMTQMESSSQKVHENLNSIIDYQTHHRLQEAQSRKRAEDLNERVLFWAVGETLGILVIAVGQVMILKNFFADKKSNQAAY
ncbi:transmembrane emp24 domain-containing protein 7 [Penaeus vannamei]|uniref:Transmembrane emp24 domain-containing protein 7 n=1 Tax=Penaeus vannamei TaxID=6689 RepID=A0A3R7QBM8_PENVA|nr:transmembrane emp24 domain-containing protein 7-like [Penaeus vannamei]ROT73827.1 transmembrane emp24 domain-containing protein 7 [Penaeus vannamei]